MIPIFPYFKNLELSDKENIEKITFQYPPYSDFNFECMWAWDVNNSIKISLLNGNLILLARDIFSNEIICSYLGNFKLTDTLANIFEFLDTTGTVFPKISFVPELSLKGLDFNKYFIEIDLKTCDYIYDLKQLSEYAGNQYMQKRGRTNIFTRNYPSTQVKIINLRNEIQKEEILNLNDSWIINKTKYHSDMDLNKEMEAIARFIRADFKNIFCVGIYQKELIGFSVFSFHQDDYVINHFFKGDVSYKGVYEFLMRESAILLSDLGFKYLNFQEDLGLPGLRQSKMTYRPISFLKKYYVNRL